MDQVAMASLASTAHEAGPYEVGHELADLSGHMISIWYR
jgi:hypothetical protein